MDASQDPESMAADKEASDKPVVNFNSPTPYPKGYQIITSFGQCCFDSGKILLATRNCESSQAPSLAVVRQYNLENVRNNLGSFIKEIWLMKHLKHENLLPFSDSFVTGHSLCIVTPLVDHGSALDLIQSNFTNGLPEPVISGILRDVLLALNYLHSRGYIHRGIRASHILVSSKGQALLTGLRDAYCIIEKGRWQKAVYDFPSDSERSLCWLSPELLQQNLRGYNEKSDIYSLGITACELANGISPYIDLSSTELLINKLQGQSPQLWDCNTVPPQERRTALQNLPSDSGVFDGVTASSQIHARLEAAAQRSFSRAFHRFTMLCVQHESSLRPSATQLLKHPFILSARKSNLSWEEYLSCVAPIGKSVDMETTAEVSTDENDSSQLQFVPWDFAES